MASAIVADGGSDVFRNGVEVAKEIFGSPFAELGMLFDCCVQILNVSAMMHIVMQGHGLLIDDRFECVVCVGQWG